MTIFRNFVGSQLILLFRRRFNPVSASSPRFKCNPFAAEPPTRSSTPYPHPCLHINHITMSTASKVTFAVSTLFAAASFVYINVEQQIERENLRQGPIKDAERMRQKMNKKQLANDLEHREQLALKAEYEKVQPLKDEIIRGED